METIVILKFSSQTTEIHNYYYQRNCSSCFNVVSEVFIKTSDTTLKQLEQFL